MYSIIFRIQFSKLKRRSYRFSIYKSIYYIVLL
nr:MAG TPA: hypothetical protein [Bacteriophage sp.]